MERELSIFEMSDAANPVSLAHSRLLQERLLKEYAATRARRRDGYPAWLSSLRLGSLRLGSLWLGSLELDSF
jgi:hypothetical protein